MDFDLSAEQKEIKGVAHELLAARSPFEKVREAAETERYDETLWSELVELGWPGIAVGEEHGGQGLGAVELAVLLEELGYACAATRFLSTATAGAVIQAAGSTGQRERWLAGLAAGELAAGIGTRELCADAAGADLALLIDGDEAVLVEAPDAEAVSSIDATRRFARVHGEGEPLGGHAAARARTAIAAEVVGVCQRALEMTVAYVKERRQFGVPVGSFQAVAHRCAEMLRHTESARSCAYYAAWAAGADPELLPEAAALAAVAAGAGGKEVAGAAIQLHGGIGFTWEADVHWMYKRAQLDASLLGASSVHRMALAGHAAQALRERVAA